MWRWISSTRAPAEEGGERTTTFALGVPPAVLPEDTEEGAPDTAAALASAAREPAGHARESATCAVEGCASPRKYRLVRDWTMGACGMGHLKALESSA
jgi:Ino eighty subunit 2